MPWVENSEKRVNNSQELMKTNETKAVKGIKEDPEAAKKPIEKNPSLKAAENKIKENNEKQESGVIEAMSPEQQAKLKNFVNTFVNNEYNEYVKDFEIRGWANDELFQYWWPRQKSMEKDLAKILTSLESKWVNRKAYVQAKKLQIPPTILQGEWSLNDEVAKLSDDKTKSNFLNEWLAMGRMFSVLDTFDKNQIQALVASKKLKITSTFHKWSTRPEDKYNDFKANIDSSFDASTELPKNLITFEAVQMEYWLSDGSIGVADNKSILTKKFNAWWFRTIDRTWNDKKPGNIYDQNTDTKIKEDKFGNSYHEENVVQVFWKGKERGGKWSDTNTKYANGLTEYAQNFDDYIIQQDADGSYKVNILLNKIDENHPINKYFDITWEDVKVWAIPWGQEWYTYKKVVSITPKHTNDKMNNHMQALQAFKELYANSKKTDTNTDKFIAQINNVEKKIENKNKLNEALAALN